MSKGSRQRPYDREAYNNNNFWNKNNDDSAVVGTDSSSNSNNEEGREGRGVQEVQDEALVQGGGDELEGLIQPCRLCGGLPNFARSCKIGVATQCSCDD